VRVAVRLDFNIMEEKKTKKKKKDKACEKEGDNPATGDEKFAEDWWDEFRRERAGWDAMDLTPQKQRTPLPPLEVFKRDWSAKTVGQSNPHEFTSKRFWQFMIYSGCLASVCKKLYLAEEGEDKQVPQDEDDFLEELRKHNVYPVWCYNRFGQSATLLPDGRRVFIAGEYEDFYDPDFFIYNDVVVLGPNGDIQHIFGYPVRVFPPTDFHTAVHVPSHNAIYIIGTVGYKESRDPNITPVYKLDLSNWKISKVETRGTMPRWLSHADGTFDGGAGVIILTGGKLLKPDHTFENNTETITLNIRSFTWGKK